MNERNETDERTNRPRDDDLIEPSPSTGWRETATALHAPDAHTVEPVDAGICGAYGCHRDQDLHRVTGPRGPRTLCPDHATDYAEVTSYA